MQGLPSPDELEAGEAAIRDASEIVERLMYRAEYVAAKPLERQPPITAADIGTLFSFWQEAQTVSRGLVRRASEFYESLSELNHARFDQRIEQPKASEETPYTFEEIVNDVDAALAHLEELRRDHDHDDHEGESDGTSQVTSDARKLLAEKFEEAARWRRHFGMDFPRSKRNRDCVAALERAAFYVENLNEDDSRLRMLDALGLDSEAIESRIARYGFSAPPDHDAFLDRLVEDATMDEANRGVDRLERELAEVDDD